MLRTDWTDTRKATPDWKIQAGIARRDYCRATADPEARLMAADRLASLQLLRGGRILGFGRVVITDRLHGYLLCLLLGLPHVILPDRYGKIASTRDTWTSDWSAARWARTPEDALAHATELAAVAAGSVAG